MDEAELEILCAALAPLGAVRSRRMFGGVGLYAGGVFFGLVHADRLYLRAGDADRARYERAGSEPFQPFADKPSMRTYWSVPERVQADAHELVAWARRALAAARARDEAKRAPRNRAARKRAPRKPRSPRHRER